MKNSKQENRNRYKKWYSDNLENARKMKRERMREYRKQNPEKYRKQSRQAKSKLKSKIFDMYGYSCVKCGFSNIKALTLDHINNDGAIDRKKHGERGVYLRALIPENKKEFQILCMNCQFIKRYEPGGDYYESWLQQHGEFLEENK